MDSQTLDGGRTNGGGGRAGALSNQLRVVVARWRKEKKGKQAINFDNGKNAIYLEKHGKSNWQLHRYFEDIMTHYTYN